MSARGWLAPTDAETLSFLWELSALIANTDRHFGNVTLLPRGERFELAPMYDVLPMLFAPQSGELVERGFELPIPAAGQLEAWRRAVPVAVAFWEAVASDARVSAAFRERAGDCARVVRGAGARVG